MKLLNVRQPTPNDTFLVRICYALQESPRQLAISIGVEYAELEPLLDERYMLVELDRDEVWWKLSEYVDKRLGTVMAVRSELQRYLQKDRARRAVRIERHLGRDKKPPPRS